MRYIYILFLLSLQAFGQSETPKDPGIRRRCEMMQAKIRRTEYLIERYRELKEKSIKLRERAPYQREVARNNLENVKGETQKRIRYYTEWTRDMKEKLVRRGCPKNLTQMRGEDIQKLIDRANSQGVFIDDHVLKFPQESRYIEEL